MLFLSCICYAFGALESSRLLCLIMKLSLSHSFPGSSVVLDCIDS